MKKLLENFKGKIYECNDYNFAGDEELQIGYILNKQNEVLKEFAGLYPRLWAVSSGRNDNLFYNGVAPLSNHFTYWSGINKAHVSYLINENLEIVNKEPYKPVVHLEKNSFNIINISIE